MDAAGDHVELRHLLLQEAPADAIAELESFSPPSWQTLVSDCSDCSSVSEGSEGEGMPSARNRPRSAGAEGAEYSEPLSGPRAEQRQAPRRTTARLKPLLGAAEAILAQKPPVTSNPPGPAEAFLPTAQMPEDGNEQSFAVGLKARLRELKDCLDEGLLTMDEFQEDGHHLSGQTTFV